MRILITGGNGFLGSHVVERLHAEGHDLRLMLRRTSSVAFLAGVPRYDRVNGDLRRPESLADAVRDIDTVVHIGGVTMARTAEEYEAANGRGTANLVQAAVSAGVRRFVYVSSLAAQGPSPDGSPRAPEATPAPVTAYGESKLSGERAVQASASKLETVILRPPAVYGPRDSGLLPMFRAGKLGVFPLLGDGKNLASFIYVDDAADAVIRSTLRETPPGAIYSFEDGTPYTWRELVGAFSRATGKRVVTIPTPPWLYKAAGYAGGAAGFLLRKALPLTPEKVTHVSQRYWICDSEAIKRDLGWQATVGIDEGMRQTLAWYKRERWL